MSGYAPEQAASWAPRHNPDLFGHETVEKALLQAWSGGRLPHAWLITGPRGVGKATLAFRFARFLLAHGPAAGMDAGPSLFGDAPALPESLHIPEEHPVFARVASAGHADLITVERSWDEKGDRWRSEIVVQDIRAVIERFGMTAAEGGYRVCIVDAADDMNTNAANALLKILEEPPPNAVLLLVSHAPGSLLPTIRSRCRRLALKPLDDAALDQATGKLLPDLDAAERRGLRVLAEGAPGRAVMLAGQGGLKLLHGLLDLVGQLPRPDLAQLHAFGDKLARDRSGNSFQLLGELFRWWLARLVRAAAAGQIGGAGWHEVFPGETAVAQRLAQWQSPVRWAEDWEQFGRLLDRGESVNLDRKQMLLNIFAVLGRTAAR
ncbi:MAG TPA: DNA polymerase III subunit delta' [Ferrovibrio sp.]|uniref:DNA polymerase III subunit delta' n=1 Tax=Ferrovibrio sp. TaxID=1917215 RepID=UPI002ED28180